MKINCKCGNNFEYIFDIDNRLSVKRYKKLGWMNGYDEFGDLYRFACGQCGKRFEKTLWNTSGQEEYNLALKELNG